MKKTISILLALVMALGLAACVNIKVAENPFDKAEPALAATEEPTAEPTAEPTEEPTAEPTEEPTPEPTAEPTAEPTLEPTPEPEARATEVPFQAIMAAANERFKALQSMRVDMDMNMVMQMSFAMGDTAQSVPMNIHMACQMDLTREPAMARVHMDLFALGQNTVALLYAAKEGDHTVLYTSADGGTTWQKAVDPPESQLPPSPDEAFELILKADDAFQRTGTEEVNGRPAAVYAGKLSGEKLRDILNSTGAAGEITGAMGADVPEDALAKLGDIDVLCMIDEESGLPVRYVMDMTAAMKDMMTAILAGSLGGAGLEGMTFQMDVSAVVLDLTLSDFDGVEPIVIPEAALNAPEA